MEKKIYKVELRKIGECDCMVFAFSDKDFLINLNSEDQSKLKDLFFAIIRLTFNEQPVFELSKESQSYPTGLFVEIAKDYLHDLNTEIEKIIENKPKLDDAE